MGSLRIIAGRLRGRRIAVPPGRTVRPTADRVREALFSILGGRVDGATVLDPFAGSGALGFEALSRGARSVTFIESDREVREALRRNAASLGVESECRLLSGRAERWIARGAIGEPFDLVLVDAPYRGSPGAVLAALERAGALAPGATVVVEREEGSPDPGYGALVGLSCCDTRHYGRTRLEFLQNAAGNAV